MVLTGHEPPGTQSNRVSSAEALSVYVQDTIDIGRWAVVPGLRYEWIDLHRVDFANPERTEVSGTRSNSVNEAIPGIGVEYEINPSSRAFLGVHRGFAPPSPSNQFAIAEDAVNYELGYRFAERRLHATAIGFLNDYSSLLGECTAATGCVGGEIGDQFNAGASRTWGLELTTGYEFQGGGSVRWPVSLVYTYTGTEFLTAFESDYEPWGQVEAGDEFPYVPPHQAMLSAGVVHPRVSAHASLVYFDRMRTVAGQGPIRQDEATPVLPGPQPDRRGVRRLTPTGRRPTRARSHDPARRGLRVLIAGSPRPAVPASEGGMPRTLGENPVDQSGAFLGGIRDPVDAGSRRRRVGDSVRLRLRTRGHEHRCDEHRPDEEPAPALLARRIFPVPLLLVLGDPADLADGVASELVGLGHQHP
jgi:hypothetical protein